MKMASEQNLEKKGHLMRPFGLTGNIGCGKSTVATLLSKYSDVLTLDCDRIAKEVISGNGYRQQINTILGTNVILDEKVDFQAIAKIIFEAPEKKRLLEALIHPLVWTTVDERVTSAGDNKICVVESAIIFETYSEGKFAAIIVATCNPHEQFRRLRNDRHVDDVQIQARLDQQLPSSAKEQRAQFVIHTDCSLDQLEDSVRNLYHNLKQRKGVPS
jgi:dephospho-CoA kinase